MRHPWLTSSLWLLTAGCGLVAPAAPPETSGSPRPDYGEAVAELAQEVLDADYAMLFVQATGQPAFRVWPESASTFRYRVVKATIDFETAEDGTTQALVLHQGGADTRGTRAAEEPAEGR